MSKPKEVKISKNYTTRCNDQLKKYDNARKMFCRQVEFYAASSEFPMVQLYTATLVTMMSRAIDYVAMSTKATGVSCDMGEFRERVVDVYADDVDDLCELEVANPLNKFDQDASDKVFAFSTAVLYLEVPDDEVAPVQQVQVAIAPEVAAQFQPEALLKRQAESESKLDLVFNWVKDKMSSEKKPTVGSGAENLSPDTDQANAG